MTYGETIILEDTQIELSEFSATSRNGMRLYTLLERASRLPIRQQPFGMV